MSEDPKNQQHPGPIHYQEKVVGNNEKELQEWQRYQDELNKKRVGRPPKGDDTWRTVRDN